MSRIFTWLGIGLLTVLGKLPYPFVARFGEALGSILFMIPNPRREVVRANLRLCFPDKTDAEIEAMSRETYRKVFRSFAEGGIFWTCNEKKMRQLVQINDQGNLPSLDGSPHILVTLHLSGLEAGAIRLTMHLRDTVGRSGASLYTVQKNALFDDFLKVARGRFGANMISRNDSVRNILRVLKKGEALQLISDMDFGERDSEFVPFFGVEALTLTSVSRLARLAGAKVVPIYTEQLPDYKGYVLHILPPWDDYPGESVTDDTRRMNAFFEDAIRPRVPDYYWVHKRFKHRPPGEPDIY
ncbi:Kdo2-lipid IVA lauroyltransferase/acyltransferase [Cupriavidus metallidurans]|jgi:Kdo2-lipid IVA lauroyltransferase/acyltransferase|uniref:Lauroyl/myristoyl acyltransferase n=2 Tax=Cupriavidus metallidurans TaxID=119219 RepID=Q1LS36_CUPMC|nr:MULTISPECIES: lipid A biosynthesis lauroyl acyltransferase [Cupriavidus]ABF07040.1 lauroyl/myristoyl acyltransferase [Cupriavidus metallidurans CH34]AVA32264.1 lauroyl acyltransferase [Cupriavidus metallidurans]KWR80462.1 lauroyl acyltransferase [Cupriavidus sp. SHE]KWW34018.1 Lipid A biosynthesis lauroyltransferase [Cupriavidus metallidurans]MDE4916463.1 lipid A biosynthesis lauroyl acyltransferase [Cupriavidus metallidurans]